MTYDGKLVVETNEASLIGIPDNLSYVSTANPLSTSSSANTHRHINYIAGDYIYVLEGNDAGSGGYSVFRAPLTNPVNLVKTGNVVLYGTNTHSNSSVVIVGDYIYMYGIQALAGDGIYKASLAYPEIWSREPIDLPFTNNNAPVTVIGSTIYIFGDGTGADLNIYTASTSAPTVFVDSGSNLPGATYNMAFVKTPTKLLMIAGYNGGIESDNIYVASTATPLTWSLSGTPFPASIQGSVAFVSGSYVYVSGGRGAATTSPNMWKSPIADGETFTLQWTNFPASAAHTLEVIGGSVYSYGGMGSTNWHALLTDLDADVATPSVTNAPTLYDGRWGYMGIGIGDTYWMYGGLNVASGLPTGGPIQSAPLNDLVTWTSRGTLPTAIGCGNVVRIDDTIYIFGGMTAYGTASNRIFSAPVSSPQTVTQISTTGPPVALAKAFIANGYIYVLGGTDMASAEYSTTYKAPITDPTEFISLGNTAPGTFANYAVAVIGSYVWTFGGSAFSAGVPEAGSTSVSRSSIALLDGSTFNWVPCTALPTAVTDPVVVMSDTHLFLIGGSTAASYTVIATVQSCSLDDLAAGISNFKSLGNFSYNGTLKIGGCNGVYSNGDFYLLGGRIATTAAGSTTIYRTSGRTLVKSFGVKESTESNETIDLKTGRQSSLNYFMRTGNLPWIVARTT